MLVPLPPPPPTTPPSSASDPLEPELCRQPIVTELLSCSQASTPFSRGWRPFLPRCSLYPTGLRLALPGLISSGSTLHPSLSHSLFSFFFFFLFPCLYFLLRSFDASTSLDETGVQSPSPLFKHRNYGATFKWITFSYVGEIRTNRDAEIRVVAETFFFFFLQDRKKSSCKSKSTWPLRNFLLSLSLSRQANVNEE